MKYKELEGCAVNQTLAILNSKWKPIILYLLFKEDKRFLELWRSIPAISRKVLTEQLRDLIEFELIFNSKIHEGYIVSVYSLTPKGRALEEVFRSIQKWGMEYLENVTPIEELVILKGK